MSGTQRATNWWRLLATGAGVGVVEAAFAIAFASLVFNGPLDYFPAEGIGLYLGAATLTLAILAWRGGGRGVIGGLQATGVALLSIVAATTAVRAHGSPYEGFLAVVAATVVVTVLGGVAFLVLGIRRRSDLVRSIPVPVVGGFVAGAGWLLVWGGLHLAIGASPFYTHLVTLVEGRAPRLWLAALAFGVVVLAIARIVRRPLVVPLTIVAALVGSAVVATVVGVDELRAGGWLLGPFRADPEWKTWGVHALTGADWLAVARSSAAIVAAVLVGAFVLLHHLGDIETVLGRDLDTDRELRDAGLLNVVAGFLGGIPGSHAPGSTAVAAWMRVDARWAGVVAAGVPLAVLLFASSAIELLPRTIVGGLLVFLGLASIVEWVWDRRRSLSPVERGVVVAILAVVVGWGYVIGIVVGLVLAVILLAISYGRIDLVHEVAFAEVYRSNVDRSPTERERLRALADRVQILRVSGYVFFGSANRLLERIRARVLDGSPPRFLVIDLQRATGVDSSAVASLVKAERLAAERGAEIVLAGATGPIRARLERGGVLGDRGLVSFAPDLDHGLERCEDALLAGSVATAGDLAAAGPPSEVDRYLERVEVAEGTVVLRQGEPPGDVYVLAEGRLSVHARTPEGKQVRVRTLRPGVVVGEIALYRGEPRTADVVAETPCVMLRCSRERIARMEAEDPVAAATLHRWFAGTLADRLRDTLRSFDELLD